MNHSFNVEIAVEYGVDAAILLDHFYFWIKKNEENERHFHDGLYWTYNSVKAFTGLFPYMERKRIARTLKKLVDEGLLVEGNYNSDPWDRTKWYALTEKGLSVYENGPMHCPEMGNAIPENGKSYNKYNINIHDSISDTDNHISCSNGKNDELKPSTPRVSKKKMADENFERLWRLYPRKQGKGNVSDSRKLKLLEIGYDQMERCITRFKDAMKDTDDKFIMYGGTFFNSGYVDFLDENYCETSKMPEPEPIDPEFKDYQ